MYFYCSLAVASKLTARYLAVCLPAAKAIAAATGLSENKNLKIQEISKIFLKIK